MAAYCFFVVYSDKETTHLVDHVCEQLSEALRGERGIITAPDGIIIEQFTIERGEAWEEP